MDHFDYGGATQAQPLMCKTCNCKHQIAHSHTWTTQLLPWLEEMPWIQWPLCKSKCTFKNANCCHLKNKKHSNLPICHDMCHTYWHVIFSPNLAILCIMDVSQCCNIPTNKIAVLNWRKISVAFGAYLMGICSSIQNILYATFCHCEKFNEWFSKLFCTGFLPNEKFSCWQLNLTAEI